MHQKKLHLFWIFINLELSVFKLYNLIMCNLYTKFVKFLEICNNFSHDLVTERGNTLRPGPIPRFSDLEVIALSMAAESEETDSENWLFESRLKECRDLIPHLISRRQFNDRRKAICGLQEQIHSRMAKEIDGGEEYSVLIPSLSRFATCHVANAARWERRELSRKHWTLATAHRKALISLAML